MTDSVSINEVKNILIVDDEEVILDYLSDILEDQKIFSNLKVKQFDNGCEAVDEVKIKKYDLIFTDFVMPKCNGFSIMKAARSPEAINKETPIICMSGYLPKFNTNVPFEILDSVLFLEKPFTEEKVNRFLKIFLTNYDQKDIKKHSIAGENDA